MPQTKQTRRFNTGPQQMFIARPLASPPLPKPSADDETLKMLSRLFQSPENDYKWYNPEAPRTSQGAFGMAQPSDNALLGAAARRENTLAATLAGQQPIDDATAARAGVDAQLGALAELPLPKRKFAPFSYGTPPERQSLPFPERSQAKLNPFALLASGVAGMIAPEGASRFTGATMQGAVDEANREYADKRDAFKYAVEQANTTFEDKMSAYERDYAQALSNLRGGEAADYQNDLVGEEAALRRIPLMGQGAGLDAMLGTVGKPGLLQTRQKGLQSLAGLGSDVSDIESRIASGLQRNAGQRDAIKTESERRLDFAKLLAPIFTGREKSRFDAAQKQGDRKFDLQLLDKKFGQENSLLSKRQGFEARQGELDRASRERTARISSGKGETPAQKVAWEKWQYYTGIEKTYRAQILKLEPEDESRVQLQRIMEEAINNAEAARNEYLNMQPANTLQDLPTERGGPLRQRRAAPTGGKSGAKSNALTYDPATGTFK